ncbi:hypothetical protein [Streptomyces sp. A5-4]|uniref:hypothetical protein n=1 Tax=Streptomyces sp. A5-4 TaxID=3384771 RepID=UPI003DA91734
MKRCVHVRAAAGAAVVTGGGPASAADGSGPLVRSRGIDLLEGVFERIGVPIGESRRAVRQTYDSRATAAD